MRISMMTYVGGPGWVSLLVCVTVGLGCNTEPEMTEPEATREPAALALPERTGPLPAPPEGVSIPEEMTFVPGGKTLIGSASGLPHEQPLFVAEIQPFLMDKHPVTVAQFRAFVQATGYVTEAEQFGDAGIFNVETRQWALIPGATWAYPLGPDRPPAEDDHPVTQVSWNDAVAYLDWAGKRLPTEVEWEHAARGARNLRQPYAWGADLGDGQAARANTWTGQFPALNTEADGYRYTSPVGAFGKTELGLTDMGGNVWEWTADWYRPYSERDTPYTPTPQSERVQRGGSFMCHASYCHGYRVSGRSHSTPETALFHVGFRGARDIDALPDPS